MIVLAIIAVLATIAVPSYVANIRHAKEAVLRNDLIVMRNAIEGYTYDKQKAPQTLDDLVQAGYIKSVPTDPITSRNDSWVTAQGDMYTTTDETQSGGIDDVHSGSQSISSDGSLYSTW
jgi:general secretion pathway protein G